MIDDKLFVQILANISFQNQTGLVFNIAVHDSAQKQWLAKAHDESIKILTSIFFLEGLADKEKQH